MKTLFALSAALLMAICHALESAKSATDLGAMPNSCRAGLASGASFGTILDSEGGLSFCDTVVTSRCIK